MRPRRDNMPSNEINERVAALEQQVNRLLSDIESEKGTRKRSNDSFDDRMLKLDERLQKVEKAVWAVGGCLMTVQLILKLI